MNRLFLYCVPAGSWPAAEIVEHWTAETPLPAVKRAVELRATHFVVQNLGVLAPRLKDVIDILLRLAQGGCRMRVIDGPRFDDVPIEHMKTILAPLLDYRQMRYASRSARARRRMKPRRRIKHEDEILELLKSGLDVRSIALATNVAVNTVMRVKKEIFSKQA